MDDPLTPDEDLTLELISEAQKGNQDALNNLVSRYLGKVRTAVRYRLGPKLRAKVESWDLVQSVMLEAVGDLNEFKPKGHSSFLNWLNTLVERKIRDKIDYFKAGKRDMDREVPLPESSVELRPKPKAPVGPREREEMDLVERALDGLSPVYRDILVQVKFEGIPVPDVASKLGRTEASVRKIVTRGLLRLTRRVMELKTGRSKPS
jgi:RNA polymerase sigma-70 factor (subfamily 1)